MVLRTVVSQQLVPGVDDSLIPAFEIMHADHAIRNMIRDNKSHQITNAMIAGGEDGMVTMDQYLLRLYQEEKISKEVLLDYCDNSESVKKRIR